jgi:hypothetical protein
LQGVASHGCPQKAVHGWLQVLVLVQGNGHLISCAGLQHSSVALWPQGSNLSTFSVHFGVHGT